MLVGGAEKDWTLSRAGILGPLVMRYNAAATPPPARRLPAAMAMRQLARLHQRLSPAGTPRATRGRPPPTRRSSAAGSPPRRRPPRPPPRRRVGRRARGGRWGTCSAWRSLWSALPTRLSRYTVASARLPATAAPSNDARSEFPSHRFGFHPLVRDGDARCSLGVY